MTGSDRHDGRMPGNVPPVTDERHGLLVFLAQQRYAIGVAAYGITDEQARLTPTAGSLSVGGLIKHLTRMEHGWIDMVEGRYDASQEDYEANFRLDPGESLAAALAAYDEAAHRTESVIVGVDDLGRAVPVPKGVPWFPDDVEAWSVRWVLLHLLEATARHARHADIV